jgi:hypothetical protein
MARVFALPWRLLAMSSGPVTPASARWVSRLWRSWCTVHPPVAARKEGTMATSEEGVNEAATMQRATVTGPDFLALPPRMRRSSPGRGARP